MLAGRGGGCRLLGRSLLLLLLLLLGRLGSRGLRLGGRGLRHGARAALQTVDDYARAIVEGHGGTLTARAGRLDARFFGQIGEWRGGSGFHSAVRVVHADTL